MPSANLSGRVILDVTGEDAEKFLQNLITTDLDTLDEGDLKPGALLSPQGKILFEFLVSRTAKGLRLDTLQTSVDDLMKRLTLYKLRAKVQIAVQPESLIWVSWQDESGVSETDSTVTDRRFPDALKVKRHYGGDTGVDAGEAEWMAVRIAHGVAEAPLITRLAMPFRTMSIWTRPAAFPSRRVVSSVRKLSRACSTVVRRGAASLL